MSALGTLMRSARTRSLVAATVRSASRGLAVGALALLGAALCHRFVASTPASLAALLLLVPVALALAKSWHDRPTSQMLAAVIDRRFATRSLIAAAWAARADAPTPASRIVLADANARSAELQRQLATLWPVRLPAASLAASVGTVLAATLMLVQPGASTRIDRSEPATLHTSPSVASADAKATDRNSSARAATNAHASGDGGSLVNEAVDDPRLRAAAGAAGEARAASAASDAGDVPGRTAGATGGQATPGTALSVRWQERARLAGGRAAGTADAGSDAPGSYSSETGDDAPIGAAKADRHSYDPVLGPALAAYVSAASRESRR